MLELTDSAREMIGRLCACRRAGSGLRIARRTDGHGLWMSITEKPLPGDVVIEVQDATVYLDEAARRRLAGRTLDARSSAQGSAFFI